tara:strand:- start:245 stop:502 length:258 start_codon:yes stop_codon:yes gene_type:complete
MEICTVTYFGLNKDNEPLFRVPCDNTIGTIKDVENYQGKFNYGSIELMISKKSLEPINDKRDRMYLKRMKYVSIYEYINILSVYI